MLDGRLPILPFLFTRLRQERATEGQTLLVDLGRSCQPGAWICDTTGGRGMLVAMDAMGYDAFHIGPLDALYTQPALVQQIRQVIATPLAAGPWFARVVRKGRTFVLYNAAATPRTEPADLLVALRLSGGGQVQAAWQGSRRLLLLDSELVEGSPVLGRVDIVLLAEPPYIRLVDRAVLTIPADLPPDPTIAGVIEFVENEARYAERKRGNV
jgi:hypothetical protein